MKTYKGYIVTNYAENYEILFYIEDDTVYQSNKIKTPNDHFKGRAWQAIPDLPAKAKFCGNYSKPF